eukprot:TRINITY_DN107_c0_g1_i2.p1 TRINITY_DN107_c0_g1~~TRINITY_DN107_c0_g1_i2.p1  ORF type:complete len:265 (+),score=47.86 TRINITY_DN107_c0_g1_i2:564-1358(+)
MKCIIQVVTLSALLAYAVAFNKQCPKYYTKVLTHTAHDADGLTSIVQKYQNLLGGENNGNNPGPLRSGQRSINWDAAAVPFNMPGDFFNTVVTRGAVFKAQGGKFAVSNPASPPPKDDRFSSLLPAFVTKQFRRFSLERLFTPVLSNRLVVKFQIPAAHDAAKVSGFGAVFTDVDLPRRTHMVYFDKNGCRIAKVLVPPKNKGLSFAGLVVVDKHNRRKTLPVISKVKVQLGNVSVRGFFRRHFKRFFKDVVVMDDLFYGEPMH